MEETKMMNKGNNKITEQSYKGKVKTHMGSQQKCQKYFLSMCDVKLFLTFTLLDLVLL
jgi:hypothetical protein